MKGSAALFKTCPQCGGTGKVMDDRQVGKDMRAERKKTGLSGREVARRIGWSAAYLSDLELGRRGWNHERRVAYLRAIKP